MDCLDAVRVFPVAHLHVVYVDALVARVVVLELEANVAVLVDFVAVAFHLADGERRGDLRPSISAVDAVANSHHHASVVSVAAGIEPQAVATVHFVQS